MQGPVEAFRSSFWTTFAIILLWSLVAMVAVVLLRWAWVLYLAAALTGATWTVGSAQVALEAMLKGLAFGAAGVFAFDLVVVGLIVLLFKVYVSPDGIRCYDFWGRYRTVAWADMIEARPFNMLGLKYLRVFSPQASPLWVPTFLAEQRRFADLVRQYGGPGHVLARAIDAPPPTEP